MFIAFACATCRRTLRSRACYRGQSMCCPGCGAAVRVPVPPPPPPAPAVLPKATGPTAPGQPLRRSLPVVACLPLGLPLVNGGNVLESALGCGLTVVCLGVIRRERWAPALRLTAVLCVAALGYGLLGADWLLARSPDRPRSSGKRATPPPHRRAMLHYPVKPLFPAPGEDPLDWHAKLENREAREAVPEDLKYAARLGELLSAAVDPDTAALVATRDGRVSHYSYPDFRYRATHRLRQPAYRAALDGPRGLLYAAASEPGALSANPHGNRERGRGDLHVYDVRALLAGRLQPGTALEPVRVVPVGANVVGLLLAPDRASLYYLAEAPGGARLVRLPAGAAGPGRALTLAGTPVAVCQTHDGKSLYVAMTDRVYALNAASLRVEGSVPLDECPSDMAASNQGIVFLGGRGNWTGIKVLDVRRGRLLAEWKAELPGRLYLGVAANGRRLYVGSATATANSIRAVALVRDLSRPLLTVGEAVSSRNGLVRGEFFLTPDSRFLVNRFGKVYRLGRLP